MPFIRPKIEPPTYSGAAALNLAGLTYYNGNPPYIDILHMTNLAFSPATWEDSNGYITGMPNGSSAFLYVLLDLHLYGGEVKSGSWVVTWTGNCSCTVSGTGVSGVSVGSNRTTFTMTSQSTLTLTVSNSSGSNANATAIKIFHADHETALNSGEIFNPDYIANITANIAFLRLIDVLKTNGSNIVNFSDFKTESQRDWTRMPPSVCSASNRILK